MLSMNQIVLGILVIFLFIFTIITKLHSHLTNEGLCSSSYSYVNMESKFEAATSTTMQWSVSYNDCPKVSSDAHLKPSGGAEGWTRVNGLKHACLAVCPKFPSGGDCGYSRCHESLHWKGNWFFCSTSMWGLSLLPRRSAILKTSQHFPIYLYQ